MIVASLATFPPRRASLAGVVAQILPQVDRLNIVFNQYETVPEQYRSNPVIHAVIPHEDTKDVGKFYVDESAADYVLFLDDDIDYPHDYVALTVARFSALPIDRAVGGYHCSRYYRPQLFWTPKELRAWTVFHIHPRKVARYRHVTGFKHKVARPMVVDQVGTGVAIMRGRDTPPYDYMRSSQKFVDVRLARWCFEQGIVPVALPSEADWLHSEADAQSISLTFTSHNPKNVADEIRTFA